jgi:Cu/Ag efflux pump CusA
MIRSVISSSLRLSVLVLVAAGVIIFVVVTGASHAAVDTLPQFTPTKVQVQTEALGLSASEVEQFITVPLEDEFNGVPYVDRMVSQSIPGLSSIELRFKPGTDIYTARQLVTERVAQGPSVVNVGTPPVMIEPLSSEGRVMMVALSSKTMPLTDLSTAAWWRIRPRLLAVPGVAGVSIWGQRDHQLQVLVDPARAAQADVSLEQIITTAGDATWTTPLSFLEASSPGADGLVDMPNQRLTIQHVLPIKTPADLAAVPVEDTSNGLVHLGDVATVVEGNPPLRGDAVLKGGPGLILVIQKLPGADTLAVTKGIEAAVADLQRGLPAVTVDPTVFRPATYVETSIANISLAALAAFLLLVLWLGVSMRSWRVALIGAVTTAVPIATALLVLSSLGSTLNVMTLAGLMMGLGVIVDDAVVGSATLRRHLQQAREKKDTRSQTQVVCEAYAEMRRPLGWAVAIVLVAGLPLLMVPRVVGAFVKPAEIAFSMAVLASTAVALVVTPVLGVVLFRHPRDRDLPAPSPDPIAVRVDRAVTASAGRPKWAYAGAIVVVVAAVLAITQARTDSVIPQLQDRNVLVQWQAAPGTSLAEMDRITAAAGASLRSMPGITDVASHVGQALMGDQPVNVDSAETWITIGQRADYSSTTAAIRRVVDGYPGVSHTVLTYPEAALAAAPVVSKKAITVRLYGTDDATLTAQASRIRTALTSVPGVRVDPRPAAPLEEPSIEIRTDVPAAALYGLKPGDVRRQTAVLIAGIPVGSYYHDEQIFDVTVWSKPETRADPTDIGNLPIDLPNGGQVPLKAIASVSLKPAPAEIDHDRSSRYVDVTANVTGADLSSALDAVTTRVRSLSLPLGYHAEVSSGLQDRQAADHDLWLAVIAVAVGIFLLMQAVFGSWGRAALLLVTVPLAASGAVLTAVLTGTSLTLGAMAGIFLALGIALRNGIVVIRGLQKVEQEGGDTSLPEVVAGSTGGSAASMAIAAVATGLVFAPFVVRGDIAGMEIMRPLGLVVLGGLITTTLFTLFVLPALYRRFVARGTAVTDPQTQGAR